MFKVVFYEEGRGRETIAEYIAKLRKQAATSKNARINFNKMLPISTYLKKREQGSESR
jgi:hypothetical protein